MAECKISIIIPVYNVEKYLRECLDSVFRQKFEGYEIICVDDASPDGSAAILEEYRHNHPNMRVITHEKNGGLSAARNTGIRAAKGTYIWFVDSDDMLADDENAMQTLYDYAEERDAQIVYFNMSIRYEYKEKEWIADNRKYCEYPEVYDGKELFAYFVQDNSWKIEACRKLIKTDFLHKNELTFYEGILHEDELFSFQCAMEAERVANINREFYIYRKREDSITTHIKNENIESSLIIIEKIFMWWKQNENDLSVEIMQAIYRDLERLVVGVKYDMNFYDKSQRAIVGSYAQRSFFDMWIRNDLYCAITPTMLERIKQYNTVIVYGAGRAGMEVVSQLLDAGICPCAVAASDKKGNPNSICGIKVRNIDELTEYRESGIVVIGVTEKYRGDIEAKLKELKFQNIV